jgi:cytochrome c biogenesis protein CcdA
MIPTLAFAFLAGVFSILSPCVLPLLPLVLGSAAAKGRSGPLLLAAGLVASFVVLSLFISLIGFSIGLDGGVFRSVSAVLLLVIGLVLAIPILQQRFSMATGPLGNWLNQRLGTGEGTSQFVIGLLLGAIWSPCVGPTLGAASLLAAKGENVTQVFLTLTAFAIGVALPLMLFGLLSRQLLAAWRGKLMSATGFGKAALGVILIATSLLILSGYDRPLEAAILDASPDWLTALTTHF